VPLYFYFWSETGPLTLLLLLSLLCTLGGERGIYKQCRKTADWIGMPCGMVDRYDELHGVQIALR